jgi:EmrB/QacA subfamily drug resistance transporter
MAWADIGPPVIFPRAAKLTGMAPPAPSAPAAPARPAHRGPVLIALMVTMALSAMDNAIVSTAVPQMVRDLGGFSLFSWVFSAYVLTQTVTIPVYGKLADLWGRKPVLIAGTIIFLIGSALCASAWSMVSLIWFRGLQGLGAGSIMATVNTLAGDLYDLAERGRVQGWLSSVWAMSAVLGPTVGGSLAQYVSWRWIFVINLPLGAAAVALIGRFLREQLARTRHRIDVAGALMVLLAAAALIFGLLQGGVAWPWLSPPSIAVFAVAAVATAAAVVAERRAAEPIVPPWFWRRRVLAGSGLGAVGLGVLLIGPTTFLPTYGQAVLGLGAVAAGGVLSAMSIGWPLASAVSARFFLRLGFRDTELIGAGTCLAAIVFFLLTTGYRQAWQPVVSTFVLGFGLGLISVCTLVGPQSTVTWEQRGVVTGTVMFCRFLGQSVGAAIFGAIFNATLATRLRAAPAGLAGQLPHRVDRVGPALTRLAALGHAAADYLRAAITAATRDVYLALAVAAVATLVGVLVIVPRRFATTAGAAASTGPGAPGGPAGADGEAGPAAAVPPTGENRADRRGRSC